MSAMERTMLSQPEALARIHGDIDPVERAAARVKGRRVLLTGTGTSWHAANIGAHWLRLAGVDAWPIQAADAALYGPHPEKRDALIVISHRGTKAYTTQVFESAR
jgi:glucosamine--fructose-6-phosphate aminotransferase (isomerizing)